MIIKAFKKIRRAISLAVAMVLVLSTFATSIETDRTWYLAGEAMTVGITADDALIAYAELCDTHGLAAGTVVSLTEGVGRALIELPSDLHSGYYLLSAYTRHNAHVSQRLIAIVNPLRKSTDDDIEWVKTTHPDSLSYVETEVRSQETRVQWSMVNMRETEGHIIQAHIKNSYDGQTFKASQICPSLSVIGKQIHYFEGKMVNDSTAVFYTFGVSGKQPIVISALTSSGISLPIELISPFATLLPKQLPHLVFHYQRSEVEARSLDMQRHQRYLSDNKTEEIVPLDYDDTAYGTKPDLTYNLDEYRQFLTVREVLLEYVSCVTNRKTDGVTKLFVRKEQSHYNTSLPTLVLIDGMPVFDAERLLNYDARRIHHINIYGEQYTFGNRVYHGILSFITRSGLLTNYPIERNMQYLVYKFPEK